MAKGDRIEVGLQIGESMVMDTVTVAQNGGTVEVERTSKLVTVSLLNRAGKPTVRHSYDPAVVKRVSEFRKDL